MQTSENGVKAIIAFEGMELCAYRCPAGVWTIGVGHTGNVDGKPIVKGLQITHGKAMELLRSDLAKIEKFIDEQPFANKLTQGQFDALVSFVFNVGTAAFRTSTLCRKLCSCAATAAEEFGRWVYGTVNGKKEKLPGLVARRKREREMFEAG